MQGRTPFVQGMECGRKILQVLNLSSNFQFVLITKFAIKYLYIFNEYFNINTKLQKLLDSSEPIFHTLPQPRKQDYSKDPLTNLCFAPICCSNYIDSIVSRLSSILQTNSNDFKHTRLSTRCNNVANFDSLKINNNLFRLVILYLIV